MSYIKRVIPLAEDLEQKSVLLLGPRQTGKSTFLKNQIKVDRSFNLLHSDVYSRFAFDPGLLRKELTDNDKIVVIDEIQKLPNLMDEVHSLIEDRKIKFVLTGSSARKLKRSHTSLLGGRARLRQLFPFVYPELNNFNLDKALRYGMLPPIQFSETPELDLRDYVGAYLKEEIAAEALARNIENFSRFLKVAAFGNGQQMNFEKTGNDALVSVSTVREYFGLLQDTLIGTLIDPLAVKGRKTSTRSKFYFFDMGVVNALKGRFAVSEGDDSFGELFEQFIFNEVRSYLSYNNLLDTDALTFWRTQRGEFEVDLVVNQEIAIEIKSTTQIQTKHCQSLLELKRYKPFKDMILVSRDRQEKEFQGIRLLHYEKFLELLWTGQLF